MVQKIERQRKLDGHHQIRYHYSRDLSFGKTADIGCGHGMGTHILSGNPKITELVGIDVDQVVIDGNKVEYPNIRFECSHLHEFKETFDSVVCLGVIEHVQNFEQTKKCLKAMLKPGGVFFYYVPYLEAAGVNIHHCISMLNEESFLDEFPNSEFLYQQHRPGQLLKEHSEVTFGIFGVYKHPA